MIRVLIGNAVHLGRPKVVSVGHRLDEAVKTVDNFIIPYDDQTHTTRTRHLTIGSFKVNGGKIGQMVFGYIRRPFGISPVSNLLLILFPQHIGRKITDFALLFRKIILTLPKFGFSPTLFILLVFHN